MNVRTTALVLAASLAACANPSATLPPSVSAPFARPASSGAQAIRNIIVVVQEDRTFNDIFAGFPGATTSFFGRTHTGTTVRLRPYPLDGKECAFDSASASTFAILYDGGKMDGWDLLDKSDPDCPYTYVRRSDVQAYWTLAKGSALDDQTFAPTFYGDFADQQYLIAGSTKVARNTYVVGLPSAAGGCAAPPNTVTPIVKNGQYEPNGPFPCFTYPTIASLLDAHHVTWKWYVAKNSGLNPFRYIKYVNDGADWKRDISSPETNVLSDLKNGTLAAVSWVTPSAQNSDDPAVRAAGGPAWVSSLVAAVRQSKYWNHAAIVVLWDDGGGGQFYDSVPPPQLDELGLGLRVPLMVISPYAKAGVSHVQLQTGGSTLKFIEEVFGLPSLATSDAAANSIAELLRQ